MRDSPTYAATTLVPISTRNMRKQETICERKILCKRPITFLPRNFGSKYAQEKIEAVQIYRSHSIRKK